jgi:hypothetical protein
MGGILRWTVGDGRQQAVEPATSVGVPIAEGTPPVAATAAVVPAEPVVGNPPPAPPSEEGEAPVETPKATAPVTPAKATGGSGRVAAPRTNEAPVPRVEQPPKTKALPEVQPGVRKTSSGPKPPTASFPID